MRIHLNVMLAFSLTEEALEMKRFILISALVILVASSCSNTNIEINENAEIVLKDELQSLYAEIIIKHDYHDIETDFSCTLLYKAYGIYSVDLSEAVISMSDSTIRVMLPHAKLGHFGIKDEEFEILGASGDAGFSGHFLDGGQLAGIEMADNERAMIENEAYEMLMDDYFISKADELAMKNITSLIREVNRKMDDLQIFVSIGE